MNANRPVFARSESLFDSQHPNGHEHRDHGQRWRNGAGLVGKPVTIEAVLTIGTEAELSSRGD